jgi:hypothetical protein
MLAADMSKPDADIVVGKTTEWLPSPVATKTRSSPAGKPGSDQFTPDVHFEPGPTKYLIVARAGDATIEVTVNAARPADH